MPSGFQWLGTHPELAARIAEVRAENKRLGDPHTMPIHLGSGTDWAAVRARSGFHDDESTPAGPAKDKPSTNPSP
jgi:hypothetical protein